MLSSKLSIACTFANSALVWQMFYLFLYGLLSSWVLAGSGSTVPEEFSCWWVNSYSLGLEAEGEWFAADSCMKRFVLQEVHLQNRAAIQQESILCPSCLWSECPVMARGWSNIKALLELLVVFIALFFVNSNSSQWWLSIKVKIW